MWQFGITAIVGTCLVLVWELVRRKHLQRALVKSEDRLRLPLEQQLLHSQKLQKVAFLAGGIAHDLNNVLSAIMGNAELLSETTNASSVQAHYAGEIKKAARSAAQLTRQLLVFSRKQLLEPSVLNLTSVIASLNTRLQQLVGADVQVVTELQDQLGSVCADLEQIELVLMHLATHARAAMPEGGKLIIRTADAELGAEQTSRYPYVKPGHYVHLSVSDTGTGATEEVMARLFEPFFTAKDQRGSTGVGLAMVYAIVKQSGGYIWVSSESGAGTTFNIYLPRVDQPQTSCVPAVGARPPCPAETETEPPRSLLSVRRST